MPAETLLQIDMFTGALVDTRTASQRQRDAAATSPRQIEMFSQRELAQYVPPPRMSLPDTATLMLVAEDPRTDEEQERDSERAARELNRSLFEEDSEKPSARNHDDEEEIADGVETAPHDSEGRKRTAHFELEKVITDITQTIAATPDVLRAQSMWLALATVEAQTAGLESASILAMLQRLESSLQKPTIIEANRSTQPQPNEASWGITPPHVPQPMSFV